jgi:ribosomal protein S18 acetylase RimI-like enzyme
MALLKEFRGKGIGASLLDQLFKGARQNNISRISLSVDPTNNADMKLYQRFGFVEVGKCDSSITMVANIM